MQIEIYGLHNEKALGAEKFLNALTVRAVSREIEGQAQAQVFLNKKALKGALELLQSHDEDAVLTMTVLVVTNQNISTSLGLERSEAYVSVCNDPVVLG